MILVTGGTGLLGSHLLFSLTKQGKKVRAVKRSSSNTNEVKKVFSFYSEDYEELFSRIEWIEGDILYPESLDPAFENVNKVYHAAAFISFDPHDHNTLIKNNREGTTNIVNACLHYNVSKLLHVSSTAVLGTAENGSPVTEDLIWSPEKFNTGYSVSKFRSEMEVWRAMEEGLNAVIINPSVIFGPGFWGKGSSTMFTNLKKGLNYFPSGGTGFVWVMDVVDAMIALMEKNISGERFIINSENLSYQQVFSMICTSLGKKSPGKKLTPIIGELAWRLDSFRSLFGFKRIITQEAIRAGQNTTRFSNEKVKKEINIEFRPIKKVIEEMAPHVP